MPFFLLFELPNNTKNEVTVQLIANSRGKAVCLSNKSNLHFACSSPLTLNRFVETDYVQYVSKINTLDFEPLIFFEL